MLSPSAKARGGGGQPSLSPVPRSKLHKCIKDENISIMNYFNCK